MLSKVAAAAIRMTVYGPAPSAASESAATSRNSSCSSWPALAPRMFWILTRAQVLAASQTSTHMPSRKPSASQLELSVRVSRQCNLASSPTSMAGVAAPVHLPDLVSRLMATSRIVPEQP